MSGQMHMQTPLARISQSPREAGHLFALATPTLEPCSLPPTPSPKHRPFAWQGAEDDADHRRAWFTHSLLLQPETWRATANGSIAARSQRRPCGDGLQQSVSIERHLSRIFPAHPRSLTRCCSRARRHSAFCFAWASRQKRMTRRNGWPMRPAGFGFQKIFCAKNAKRFPEPSEKDTPTALGSGAHSRRVAQECPEGNPGKSKQEKLQWHSIPTPSL
jgi:hypothetical protein